MRPSRSGPAGPRPAAPRSRSAARRPAAPPRTSGSTRTRSAAFGGSSSSVPSWPSSPGLSARYSVSLFPPGLEAEGPDHATRRSLGSSSRARKTPTSAARRPSSRLPPTRARRDGGRRASRRRRVAARRDPIVSAPDLNTLVRHGQPLPVRHRVGRRGRPTGASSSATCPEASQALGVTSVVTANRIELSEIPVIRLIAVADSPDDAVGLPTRRRRPSSAGSGAAEGGQGLAEDRIVVEQLTVPQGAIPSGGSSKTPADPRLPRGLRGVLRARRSPRPPDPRPAEAATGRTWSPSSRSRSRRPPRRWPTSRRPRPRSTAIGVAAFGRFEPGRRDAARAERDARRGRGLRCRGVLVAMRELSTPTVTWPNAIAPSPRHVADPGPRLPAPDLVAVQPRALPHRPGSAARRPGRGGDHGRRRSSSSASGCRCSCSRASRSWPRSSTTRSSRTRSRAAGPFKSLSYYLGFLAVFVLVASTIKTQAAMDTVVRALVIGATIVAFSAIYESRSGYNVFDQLADWIPVLIREPRVRLRGARRKRSGLRVAQHPIALSAALFMAFPLALYLVGRASSSSARASGSWRRVSAPWGGRHDFPDDGDHGGCARDRRRSGCAAEGRSLLAVPARPADRHPLRSSPGRSAGSTRRSLQGGGLAADAYARPGEQGSGRLADLGPGLRLWDESPLFGKGIGTQVTTEEAGVAQTAEGAQGAVIIFDNEWLNTLVALGVVGIMAAAWFVLGSLIAIGRFARRVRGPRSDLAAACAASIGAFGIACSSSTHSRSSRRRYFSS